MSNHRQNGDWTCNFQGKVLARPRQTGYSEFQTTPYNNDKNNSHVECIISTPYSLCSHVPTILLTIGRHDPPRSMTGIFLTALSFLAHVAGSKLLQVAHFFRLH